MHTRRTAANTFWSSKLGHAALASVGAMVMMIALTSQFTPGTASAALIAYPASESGAMIEIA